MTRGCLILLPRTMLMQFFWWTIVGPAAVHTLYRGVISGFGLQRPLQNTKISENLLKFDCISVYELANF